MKNKIEQLIGHLISRTARNFHKRLQRNFKQAGYNLSAEQWSILKQLYIKDKQTQQELCDITSKDKPSLTRIISNLEKLKLVNRVQHPTDKRINIIHLTAKSEEMREALIEISAKTSNLAIKNIKPEDLAVCKSVLNKMIENTD